MKTTTTGRVNKRYRHDHYYPDAPSDLFDKTEVKLRYTISHFADYMNSLLKDSDFQFRSKSHAKQVMEALFSAVYRAMVAKDVDFIVPYNLGTYKISASYVKKPKFIIDWGYYRKTQKIVRKRYSLKSNRYHFFKWCKNRHDKFRGNMRFYSFKPVKNRFTMKGEAIMIQEILDRAKDPYRLDFERI